MEKCKSLKCPDGLHKNIQNYYSLAAFDLRLKNMLLSPNGNIPNTNTVSLCTSCESYYFKNATKKKPGKFAIANGLYMAVLPTEFKELNPMEIEMCAQVQLISWIRTNWCQSNRYMRGHSYACIADPTIPAKLIPRNIAETRQYYITLVGPKTKTDQYKHHLKTLVRKDQINAFCDFLIENNILYTNVGVVDLNLGTLTDNIINAVNTSECPGEVTSHHLAETEDPNLLPNINNKHYTSLLTTNTLLSLQPPNVILAASNQYIKDRKGENIPLAFPGLYPYGTGGPTEVRETAIGLAEYVKHVLKLSHRTFAQHNSFGLIMFDLISVRNVFHSTCLRTKMNPALKEKTASVTLKNFQDWHSFLQRKEENPIQLKEPVPAHLQNVFDVNRQLEIISAAHFGSNAEKFMQRTRELSYDEIGGLAHINITLTPNSHLSYTVISRSGCISAGKLESCNAILNHYVSTEKRKLIVLDNPYYAAEFFDMNMQIFIKYIIGWDNERKCPTTLGGLFGIPKHFFAAVESQGEYNLHCHCNIWLKEFPETLPEFRRLLSNTDYQIALLNWYISIFSCTIPTNEVYEGH